MKRDFSQILIAGRAEKFRIGETKMQKQITKFAGAAGSLMLVAGLLSAAIAAPKSTVKVTTKTTTHKMTTTSKTSQVTGKVISVKGDWLTIKPTLTKLGASKKIMVPASAKVMKGSKAIKLSSIKAGHKVTVLMSGSRVTRVNAA